MGAAEIAAVLATYYYRWRSYKKHMKWSSDGWILTEFLPCEHFEQPHSLLRLLTTSREFPALCCVLVCTRETFTKGRSIFSRSTEN